MTIQIDSLHIKKVDKIPTDKWPEVLFDPWDNLLGQFPHLKESTDIAELVSWHRSQADKMPELMVRQRGLSDSNDWTAILFNKLEDKPTDPATEVFPRVWEVCRLDGQFFRIVGADCIKTDRVTGKEVMHWDQPLLHYQEVDTPITLFGRELNVPVFGLLAVLRDTEGKLLMSTEQEVASENPNHAIVRLPVQASSGKIAMIRAGNMNADKNLVRFLEMYCDGSFENLINTADAILPIAPEDTNRDLKHNLALLLPPTVQVGSELHTNLTDGGTKMWLSETQWAAVCAARLTNSHTAACVDLAFRFYQLKNIK